MSRTIDKRVVEMEFDNSRFEKNVDTSLSTLDKLKAALHFRDTDTNFDTVERQTVGLTKSFSVFEEIMSGALRRLGGEVEAWAAKTIKAMSGVQNMQEGFKKFSDITESTGTLKAQGFAMEDIERELERLNWFTDETSYNLTDMVGNISKFTAAGQNLTDSADAMMGIALWAAMAGQDASTASRAMYQLSQAMSTYMKRQDWMSIQNANMDTVEFRQKALDAAVAAGTLEKNAQGMYRTLAEGAKKNEWFSRDQFVESLTEGQWFTKDVMMKVFRDYSAAVNDIYDYVNEHAGEGLTASKAIELLGDQVDEFGLKAFKAGQEARTWKATVDSVKDALSTGWMSIFKYIFGNYEEATRFYTTLANDFYDIFVEPVNSIVEVFEGWYNAGGRDTFIGGLIEMIETAKDFMESVSEIVDKIFFGDKISKMAMTFKKDEGPIGKQLEEARKLSEMIDKDVSIISDAEIIYGNKVQVLMNVTDWFRRVADAIKEANENTDGLKRAIAGIAAIFDMVGQAIGGFVRAISPLFDGAGSLIEGFFNVIGGVGDALVKMDKAAKKGDVFYKFFSKLLKPIINLKKAIGEFINAFLPKFTERWENLKKKLSGTEKHFEGITKRLTGLWETIKSKWDTLFTNFDAEKFVDKLFAAWDKLKGLLADILGIEDGDFDSWIAEKLAGAEKSFDDFSAWATKTFENVWKNAKYYFGLATSWIEENWGDIVNFIKGAAKTIWAFFSGLWDGIKGIFSTDADENGVSSFESMVNSFKQLGEMLGKVFSVLLKAVQPAIDGLKNTFETMNFENLGSFLTGGGILALGIGVKSLLSPINAFGDLLESFGGVLNSFTHLVDAKALKEAGIGIALLVGSILLLISMPEGQMMTGALVLSSIIYILANAVKKLGGMSKKLSWSKDSGLSASGSSAGGVLLAFAVSMILIATALRMIAKIPEKELYQAATVISVLMVIVGFVAKSLSRNVHKVGAVGSGNTFIKAGAAGTILALALFLFTFMSALEKMSALRSKPNVKLTEDLLIIGGIVIGLLFLVGVFLKVMPKKVDSGVWLTIVAITAGLYIVVAAIEKLATFEASKDRIGQAIGAVVVILLAMIGLAAVLKNASFDKLGKMAGGMAVMVLVIVAISYIIIELSKAFKDSDPTGAIAAIVVIAVVIGALGALMSSKKLNGDRMMKSAAAIGVLAAAIAIAAGSLWIISKIPTDKIWTAVKVFAGLAVAITVLGLIGKGVIGDGLMKLGKALMFVGIAVGAAGIGFLGVAEAIRIFGDSTTDFKKAGQNISTFIDEIMMNIPDWIGKIVSFGIEMLLSWVPGLITGLLDTLEQVLDALLENDRIVTLVDKACLVAIKIMDGITKNTGELIPAAGRLVMGVLNALNSWVSANKDAIVTTIHETLQNLWDIVVKFFDPLGEKIFGESWGEEGGVRDKLTNNFIPWAEGIFLIWFGTTFVGGMLSSLAMLSTSISGVLAGFGSIMSMGPGVVLLAAAMSSSIKERDDHLMEALRNLPGFGMHKHSSGTVFGGGNSGGSFSNRTDADQQWFNESAKLEWAKSVLGLSNSVIIDAEEISGEKYAEALAYYLEAQSLLGESNAVLQTAELLMESKLDDGPSVSGGFTQNNTTNFYGLRDPTRVEIYRDLDSAYGQYGRRASRLVQGNQ